MPKIVPFVSPISEMLMKSAGSLMKLIASQTMTRPTSDRPIRSVTLAPFSFSVMVSIGWVT